MVTFLPYSLKNFQQIWLFIFCFMHHRFAREQLKIEVVFSYLRAVNLYDIETNFIYTQEASECSEPSVTNNWSKIDEIWIRNTFQPTYLSSDFYITIARSRFKNNLLERAIWTIFVQTYPAFPYLYRYIHTHVQYRSFP